MDSDKVLNQLTELHKSKEWFHSVGKDAFGRYVVYVHFMNRETLDIPDLPDGRQVLVHFARSITATANQFMNTPQTSKPSEIKSFLGTAKAAQVQGIDTGMGQMLDELDHMVVDEEEEKSILYLQKELDRLEKICGSYTLQDVFYEIQDGKNAVTNMSARYPDVRKGLEKLYKLYGFDVIYEELDG